MAQGSFSASVGAWVAATRQRATAVRNEAAQRVVETMNTLISQGGRMRVDTGFLRASLVAINGEALPSQTLNPGDGSRFSYDAGAISLVIAGADLTDTLTFVYTANYSKAREYGSRGQPADAFVRLAAQQWPRIVQEVAQEAQSRAAK